MKNIKVIFLFTALIFFSSESIKAETKKDCNEIKNLYKKIICKTNNATSGITSKKSLSDFLKEKKQ